MNEEKANRMPELCIIAQQTSVKTVPSTAVQKCFYGDTVVACSIITKQRMATSVEKKAL